MRCVCAIAAASVHTQALCHDMRATGALDAESRRAALNWRDDDGRSGLMLASAKNHLHVAQIVSVVAS
jgi:hypothetical protein